MLLSGKYKIKTTGQVVGFCRSFAVYAVLGVVRHVCVHVCRGLPMASSSS